MAKGRRARIPGRPSTRILCLRLTDEELADLSSVAADNQTSLVDVIRDAVNEYVGDYRDRQVFPICKTKSNA